jgi:hypothetical protein
MTYSSSLGQSGLGASISIGTATSGALSTVWTQVGETDDIPDFIPEWEMVDTTNLQSSMKEMKPTILGTKDVSLSGNRVSNNAGYVAALAAYAGAPPVPFDFQIILPKNAAAGQTTAGDKWTFSAYVKKCGPKDLKATEWTKFAIDLTIVSAPLYTPGS